MSHRGREFEDGMRVQDKRVALIAAAVILMAAAGLAATYTSLSGTHRSDRAFNVSTVLAAPPPTGSAPQPWAPSSGPGETRGPRLTGRGVVAAAVGQLSTGCGATVIPSTSRRVAVTAAHCVYTPPSSPWHIQNPQLSAGWRPGLSVQPGRVGDVAPYGTWMVEHAWVDQRWITDGAWEFDFAFIMLAAQNGDLIQDVVGAEGIRFDNRPQFAVTVVGYPVLPPFDGRRRARRARGRPWWRGRRRRRRRPRAALRRRTVAHRAADPAGPTGHHGDAPRGRGFRHFDLLDCPLPDGDPRRLRPAAVTATQPPPPNGDGRAPDQAIPMVFWRRNSSSPARPPSAPSPLCR